MAGLGIFSCLLVAVLTGPHRTRQVRAASAFALLFSCVLSPLSARVGYPPRSLSLLSPSAFSLSLSLACTAVVRKASSCWEEMLIESLLVVRYGLRCLYGMLLSVPLARNP